MGFMRRMIDGATWNTNWSEAVAQPVTMMEYGSPRDHVTVRRGTRSPPSQPVAALQIPIHRPPFPRTERATVEQHLRDQPAEPEHGP